jgi:hypothetical protein
LKAKRIGLTFAQTKNDFRGQGESWNLQGISNRIKQFFAVSKRRPGRLAVGDTTGWQPALRWGIAAVVMIAACSSLACGPWFPNNMLDRGDAAVLVAPIADFYGELDRIPANPTSVRAVVSTPNSYTEDTLQAELADLRAALKASGKSSNEVERIVLSHAEQRAKMQKFSDTFTEWKSTAPVEVVDGEFKRGAPLELPPAFPSPAVVDGLPGEFADYFRGAIAWSNPNASDKSAARTEWEHLLNRTPEERHYKSTWAAYMLGRSWEAEDPRKAREYYQQVRALAAQGFADTSGLAAASIGWEARLALKENKFDTALDLYLQQYVAGSAGAAESLMFSVAKIVDIGPKAMAPLVQNPQARRLITAYLISRHPYDDDAAGVRESAKAWLEIVEQANIKDVESAEEFALAAYQADDMDAAIRWVNRAGNSPTAQWLTAKLLLRAGKVERATQILSQVVNSFPAAFSTNDATSLGDSLFIVNRGEGERVAPGRYILGELGALRLSRREYVQALDLLLRGDFTTDADYVADRVLTTDELKSYVDASWPAIPPSSDKSKSEAEIQIEVTTAHIRHLLARRLTRESHGLEARPYFPEEWLPAYERLMAALNDGWNESLPGEQRAASLRAAAYIARTNGMELMATEADPDWHSSDGEFGWRFQFNYRCTNEESTVVAVSAEELKRDDESKPEPDKRFHYRYQAATLAWEAAKFMPNNSDDTARLLCDAGSWLKAQDPDAADLFYKALVLRCRKTDIGAEADEIRWFPTFDGDGNVVRTRLETLELPTAQELSDARAISRYPIPGKYFLMQDGDHIRYVASAVKRLGFSLTAKDIFAANPAIRPDDNITGRLIYVPIPGSDVRPEPPPAVEQSTPEAPPAAPDSGDGALPVFL